MKGHYLNMKQKKKLIIAVLILMAAFNMYSYETDRLNDINIEDLSRYAYAGEESGEDDNTDPIYEPFSMTEWFDELLKSIGITEE